MPPFPAPDTEALGELAVSLSGLAVSILGFHYYPRRPGFSRDREDGTFMNSICGYL